MLTCAEKYLRGELNALYKSDFHQRFPQAALDAADEDLATGVRLEANEAPATTIPVKCQTAAIMIPILKANSLAQLCLKNSPSRNMQDPLQS
jgi:hypothetical protein